MGLWLPSTAIYWNTVRECYESYVLYNFLCYLLNFLNSEYDLHQELTSQPPVRQPVPFCYCPPWPRGTYVCICTLCVCMCVRVRACVLVRVCACVRVCVCAIHCVCVYVCSDAAGCSYDGARLVFFSTPLSGWWSL